MERNIPFSIENMDVSDTPEVRDLFACVAAVVDLGSDASLFRVAALPQFKVDPEELRSALRKIAQDAKQEVVVPLASVIDTVPGGRPVLDAVCRARDEVALRNAKTRAALEIIARQFELDLNSAALQTALEIRRRMGNKGNDENQSTWRMDRVPRILSSGWRRDSHDSERRRRRRSPNDCAWGERS